MAYDDNVFLARCDELQAAGVATFLASICHMCQRALPRIDVRPLPPVYDTLVLCVCGGSVTTAELLDAHGLSVTSVKMVPYLTPLTRAD